MDKYRFLLRFLLKTSAVIGAIAVILIFVLRVYRMEGNYMFLSIWDGDLCIFYQLEDCYSGDVVLYEDTGGQLKVGRIAAVCGQTVDFPAAGGYELDGYQPTEEIPYETYADENSTVTYPVTLDRDSYFILNDFRMDTTDSRQDGAVDQSQIKGKLLFLLRRRGF